MTDLTSGTATPGIDGITALQRAYDDLAAVVAPLTTDQLALPTNCPGWDVRTLLNHTLGTAVMFTKVNAGEFVGEDAGQVVINVSEVAVHSWDLAVATDHVAALDAGASVPSSAPMQDRLLGLLGRAA
jgi:Mycothiol maleylpyruvate isomerase N-terminal domain